MDLTLRCNSRLRHHMTCILAGGLLPLAFAPFHFFWLAMLCPAALLYCWAHTHEMKTHLRHGFLFGFAFFATGTSWVYISMHQFGGMNSVIAFLVTVGFIAVLGLIFLVQTYFLQRFFPYNISSKFLLAFPAIWVLFEWIRGWLLSGFPWLFLAYSQTHSPLAGYAPLLGCFGVSLLTALMAGLLVNAFLHRGKNRLHSVVSIIAIIILGALFNLIHWTHPIGQSLSVSLIQGNIPQSLKWQPKQVQPTLKTYHTLTEKNWADLVIWPEAAIPLPFGNAKALGFLNQVSIQAKSHNSTVITGIPAQTEDFTAYYNAVVAVGNNSGFYAKRHLVPFGEYSPFLIGHVMKLFGLPTPDLVPGKMKQALLNIHSTTSDIKIAPLVCYEVAYSHLIYSDLPEANLFINVSNDAWFGRSFAAEQQLQIAQFAALESGRYLLAVTNNGVTAIVNNKGQITQRIPRYETGVLKANVQAMTGRTPWALWGNSITLLACITMLWIARKKQKS